MVTWFGHISITPTSFGPGDGVTALAGVTVGTHDGGGDPPSPG